MNEIHFRGFRQPCHGTRPVLEKRNSHLQGWPNIQKYSSQPSCQVCGHRAVTLLLIGNQLMRNKTIHSSALSEVTADHNSSWRLCFTILLKIQTTLYSSIILAEKSVNTEPVPDTVNWFDLKDTWDWNQSVAFYPPYSQHLERGTWRSVSGEVVLKVITKVRLACGCSPSLQSSVTKKHCRKRASFLPCCCQG